MRTFIHNTQRFACIGLIAGLLPIAVMAADAAKPEVSTAVRYDESAAMREVLKNLPPAKASTEQDVFVIPNRFPKASGGTGDALLRAAASKAQQNGFTGVAAPMIDRSFLAQDYTSCAGGCLPSDANGDVSPNEYIQWVNTSWAIYDKTTGERRSGPTAGNSFWAGFGGPCQNNNDGDPIVLWDDHAQRWVMAQFVATQPGTECVAISKTADPLGTYYRYQFNFSNFPDYPKLGIWTDESGDQDAYVLLTHEFNGSDFAGASFIALERDKMLQGMAAKMVRFAGLDAYGAEGVHLDGSVKAPAGACPMFVHFDGTASDYLFWDLCLDWSEPQNSSLSSSPKRVPSGQVFAPNDAGVAQPGTTARLDSFGTHVMYRATARAFPRGAPYRIALALNHAVLGAAGQGAIKWAMFDLEPQREMQVLAPTTVFNSNFEEVLPTYAGQMQTLQKRLVQEGAYAPDANSRWLGASAIDASANLGIGFTVAGSSQAPALRTSGRTLTDATGTLRDEQSCTLGTTGSQNSTTGRWGDYASMSVDPADQCTFWYTSQYMPITSAAAWSTRICSFRFAGCGQPDFALVADNGTRQTYCAASAGDPQFNLRIGVLNGFDGTLKLAASSLPAATQAVFSSNPLAAPGNTALTLAGAGNLAAGDYSLRVEAGSGNDVRGIDLQLGVSLAPAIAPTLHTPLNGASEIGLYPTLSWSAVSGALGYTLQIASDAGFTTLVANTSLSGTSWTATTPLAPGRYYWRVTADNHCGPSAASVVQSFTTVTPGQCPTGTAAQVLLDDPVDNGQTAWTIANGSGTNAVGTQPWSRSQPVSGTGITSTAWNIVDNTRSSDRLLISPVIAIPAGIRSAFLSYDTYYSFETDGATSCWDGASIEVKAGSGVFTYLDYRHMHTTPYTGIVADSAPLAGRRVWCHKPATAQHAVIDLGEFAGQTLQIAFRATSDTSGSAAAPNGMFIDNVRILACLANTNMTAGESATK